MAEGLWRRYGAGEWVVFSAGVSPVGVNPLAVAAMHEIGFDITEHASKSLEQFRLHEFDLVVTVCGKADRYCPDFPGATEKEHWPFDDPAAAGGSDEERMGAFRRVRDEIAARIKEYLAQVTS